MDNVKIKQVPLKEQKAYLTSQLKRLYNPEDKHFRNFTDYQNYRMKQMFISLLSTVDTASNVIETIDKAELRKLCDTLLKNRPDSLYGKGINFAVLAILGKFFAGEAPTENREEKYLVHWPSGPVVCCAEHAEEVVSLGKLLGSHIVVSVAPDGGECGNCRSEGRLKEARN